MRRRPPRSNGAGFTRMSFILSFLIAPTILVLVRFSLSRRRPQKYTACWPTATSPTSWESKERATVKFLRTQNPLNQESVNETSCLDTDGDFYRWPATSQSLHRESRWYATRVVRAVRESSRLPPGQRLAGRACHYGGDEHDRPPRAIRAMEG
jgi:hypothetical protein